MSALQSAFPSEWKPQSCSHHLPELLFPAAPLEIPPSLTPRSGWPLLERSISSVPVSEPEHVTAAHPSVGCLCDRYRAVESVEDWFLYLPAVFHQQIFPTVTSCCDSLILFRSVPVVCIFLLILPSLSSSHTLLIAFLRCCVFLTRSSPLHASLGLRRRFLACLRLTEPRLSRVTLLRARRRQPEVQGCQLE